MERRETQFISKSEKELGHVADLVLHEYENEPAQALFDLMHELKKDVLSGEVVEHFNDWSRAERIKLVDVLFWKLDQQKQNQFNKQQKSA